MDADVDIELAKHIRAELELLNSQRQAYKDLERDRDLWRTRCESAAETLSRSRAQLAEFYDNDGTRTAAFYGDVLLTLNHIDAWQKEVRGGA